MLTIRNKCLVIIAFMGLLQGCVSQPAGVEPVANFEVERYLGEWYEVARLDHSFERGMTHVTARYRLRDDGGVEVLNRGYLAQESEWREAQGKAYFVEGDTTGFLKVSFFGPFYGSYIIFELDEAYDYAFVSGPTKDYLWLLARTPEISHALKERFQREASARGFEVDELIWVDHTLAR